MSTRPLSLKSARKPVNVTTAITVLALVFGLAFGICSVSGISLSNGGNPHSARLLIATAFGMGAACVAGLIAVAVFATIRSRRR